MTKDRTSKRAGEHNTLEAASGHIIFVLRQEKEGLE